MSAFETIVAYDNIMTSLKDDIKNSNYKVQYFLDLLNLKSGFFYKKIKEKRFTSDEMKILAKHLYPESYEEYQNNIIDKALAISKKEIRNGNGHDFPKYLKKLKAEIDAL